ncbi:MAG TPA: hypothetical protein VEA16_18505 [Vicinamibacterales bacterium]|nr:hypothetical protein [Vicinamibacterales bacterium]
MLRLLKRWWPFIKDGAQVFGFLGVGVWTLFVYTRAQAPEATGQVLIEGAMTSVIRGDQSCEVSLLVRLSNNGKAHFRVDKVLVRAWSMPLAAASTPKVIPIADIREQPPLDQRVLASSALIATQAPGEKSTDAFFLILPKASGERILFDAEVTGEMLGVLFNTERRFNSNTWDYVCAVGPPPAEPAR